VSIGFLGPSSCISDDTLNVVCDDCGRTLEFTPESGKKEETFSFRVEDSDQGGTKLTRCENETTTHDCQGVSDRVYTEHLGYAYGWRAWGLALETAESMVLIPKHAGARPPWAELAPTPIS